MISCGGGGICDHVLSISFSICSLYGFGRDKGVGDGEGGIDVLIHLAQYNVL